jgi:clostripain
MNTLLRIYVSIMIITLMLSVIPSSLGEEKEDDLVQWTFMVYLDCDNNLESAGIEDINEMETVGSTDDVNIVVQMDRSAIEGYDESNGDWTDAKRFYVTQDQDMNIINSDEIMDLDEVNMGDPQTLTNFTIWAIDNYPAENYALVLWDHGGAFWGVCWDDDNDGDMITMPELKCALERIEDHLGRDLDLVGFDACLMAQMAVMYQMRNSVDYGVGSGYTEPGEGWPYEKILPRLVSDPGMNPEELGKIIADEYVASYTDREEDPDDTTAVTQTVFELEKFGELANRLDILSMILATKAGYLIDGGHNEQIRFAREATNSYDFGSQYFPANIAPFDPTGYCMYDLIDLMDNLNLDIPFDPEVRDAAQDVKNAANDAIIYSAVNPYHGNVKGANGLTVYFPSGLDTQYDDRFNEVDFAVDTYWDEFLHHYHNIENVEDTPPSVNIQSPKDDENIDRNENKIIAIKGTAFDAQNTLAIIEIKIDDGVWIPVGASTQWYHELSLSRMENGNHTIYARSFDGDEYSAEDSVKIFVAGEIEKGEEFPAFIIPLLITIFVVVVLFTYFMNKKRKKAVKTT